MVGQYLQELLPKETLIRRVVGFRIGALFAFQNFVRQKAPCGFPKKALDYAVFAFHVPGHVPEIFDNAMIRERYPCLQAHVHAGAIHPVEEGLHKPAKVKVGDLAAPFLLLAFSRKGRAFAQGLLIGGSRVVLQGQELQEFLAKQHDPGRKVHRPREDVRVKAFLFMEPGVATEDFIRTFAG